VTPSYIKIRTVLQ